MANMNFLQGRGFVGHSLTIGSVFPRELRAERQYSPEMTGGRHIFVLPAAPKGQCRTLPLTDCWELVMSDRSKVGAPQFDQNIVKVEDIANCLLNEWAVNIAGTRLGHRPGIIVVKGDQPTVGEIAQMNAMQSRYFDGLIEEACAYAAQHHWKLIGEPHRDAAKWRGVDPSEDRYKWVNDLGEGQEKKECFWCASKILARAKYCMHCQRVQPGVEDPAALAAVVAPATVAEVRRGKPMPGVPQEMTAT